jgi:YD repeat-containing protein
MSRVRSVVVSLVVCAVATAYAASVAVAGTPSATSAPMAEGPSLTGSPLVVPGAEPLLPGQTEEAEAAKRMNPEAVAVRIEDETKFENLDTEQAAKVDGESFSEVIDSPGGGPPQLPTGQRLTGFMNGETAHLELGEGQQAIVESTVPMAVGSAQDGWTAINLGLSDTGDAFTLTNPLVNVVIPKQLTDGVQLPDTGISVTPTDGTGTALGGSGTIDGTVVLYANTQTDTDTMIKPTSLGFDAMAVLRSVNSSQQLDYRIGLPQGASLVQEEGSDVVRAVKEGVTIAQVLPPVARDAAGTTVPVSMAASGDILVLSIEHHAGSYRYPIEVDPEFNTSPESLSVKNWHSSETNGYTYSSNEGSYAQLSMEHKGSFPKEAWSYWGMQPNGDSSIYKISIHDKVWPLRPWGPELPSITYPYMVAWLEIAKEGIERHEKPIVEANPLGSPPLDEATLCSNSECSPTGVAEHNLVRFEMSTTESSKFYEENGYWEDLPFGGSVEETTTYLSQPKTTHSTVAYNTTAHEIEYTSGGKAVKTVNLMHSTGSWFSPSSGAFEFESKDAGIGVSETDVEILKGATWETILKKNYLAEGTACSGVQCAPTQHEILTWSSLGHLLPNGTDTVRVSAHDAMSGTSSSEHGEGEATINVDSAPPHNFTVSGVADNKGVYELAEAEVHLKVEAADGEGTVPSSGVKSLAIEVDGHQIGSSQGYCSLGPCTASGEWALNGAELGAGGHVLTIVGVDNAGNYESTELSLVVNHASPIGMGPGSVNPESGDFALEATDVDMSGSTGGLVVSRHYDSRNTQEGGEGPLGPQWTISLGSLAMLEVLPDGSVMSIGPDGLTHFSKKTGGGFEAPTGDTSLTLEAVEKEKQVVAYLLKDPTKGTTTKFTLPTGAKTWMPTLSEGPVATDTMTDEYKTEEPEAGKKVVEPILEVAPHPTATCAYKKLEDGCRALEFGYGESTTATGEGEGEWGNYKGRLKEVSLVAWEPSKKEIKSIPVAHYLYDGQGRLRAEWDPRISPELKTTYGYDKEGHVTAVSLPGQQPWLMRYGTLPGDSSTGRLLSVTRPAASTSFGDGNAPSESGGLALSPESPAIGTTEGVSSGTWSNSPLIYNYQWEDCSTEGCTPILGADNPTYTPLPKDAGYQVAVRVSATNAAGTSSSLLSNAREVPLPASKFSESIGGKGENGGQYKEPADDAIDSEGDMWVADTNNARVEELSPSGAFLLAFGWGVKNGKAELQYCVEGSCRAGIPGSGVGQFSKPEGIAINQSTGDVYVTEKGNNRVQEFGMFGEFIDKFGESGSGPGQMSAPLGIAIEPGNGDVWVGDSGNNRVDEFTAAGGFAGSFGETGERVGQFKTPDGIAFSGSYAYIVDSGNDRVQKCNLSGVCLSTFGSKGSEVGEFSAPTGIASDPVSGDLYVADYGNSRVQELNPAGTFVQAFGKHGTGNGEFDYPDGVAVTHLGSVWVTDLYNDRIEKFKPAYSTNDPLPEPPSVGTAAVSTIDYQVPVSGTGVPHAMGASEVSAWGQSDDPVEATAIFPPDEPEGWPAKEYKRASILYLDSKGRAVNAASPSGAISTTEYNGTNDVVRTLSAENRAVALKEANPKEASELLDTRSKYNGETKAEQEKEEKEKVSEAGARLLETLGPQHTVKLASGSEVQARSHTVYSYDEGAPSEGGPYDLATKVTVGAQIAGKEEAEVRTTTTSYSGQENLGWKLREPTSVTTGPSGVKITHTTIYEPTTGDVIETRSPGDLTGESSPPIYNTKFGSAGTGAGQFDVPVGMAVDASGNIWVADSINNRIEKFSSTGSFIETLGWGVSNGEAKYETCTSSCRVGIEGSGNGQFSEPKAIAINPSTGNIYIVDSGNDRIQEISSSGTFIRAFGSEGSGTGELSEPQGAAIDSKGYVWVADAGNNRIEEFNEEGKSPATFGSAGTGTDEFETPNDITISWGNLYVADYANNRIDELSPTGAFIQATGYGVLDGASKAEVCTTTCRAGIAGSGNGQFSSPARIATDPNSGDLYVSDHGNTRVVELAPGGAYLGKFGASGSGEGQFTNLKGVTVNSAGDVYTADGGNNRIEQWNPPSKGNTGAHDTVNVYYTATPNAIVSSCGEHHEWVGLPCQTQPLAQPETSGLPDLPATTTKYNVWDEPETITETFGTTTRTKKTTYDTAGRALTSEVSSTNDTAVPAVTNHYESKTGALVEQTETVKGKEKAIASKFNSLGQLESYTDADGSTTTYKHDVDGRVTETTTVIEVGGKKETTYQKYNYEETTGFMDKLEDSGAKTFTAVYNAAGRMTSETYPNNMTAIYTRNTAGETTGVEYKKNADCEKTCPEVWFKDTAVPSIHGEILKQSSTLAEEPSYTYDEAGRLTQVQETPVGKGCTTRIYSYEEESNRTSLTTRVPGGEGKCATEGGTSETHSYDTADRMTDSGISYEPFGNITKLPGADAGGAEMEIKSSYYADSQVASQTQNSVTSNYSMDPDGRVRETETIAGGKTTTTISHYSAPGTALAWISEPESKWTRDIPGIDGSLSATQTNSGTVTLLLHDLQGNVVASTPDLETETKAPTGYNSTEFGVPLNGPPPKYAWLGADGIATEQTTGTIVQDGITYVPLTGRPLQTQGVTLPVPTSQATDNISTLEPWVAQTGGTAAALQEVNWEKAKKKLEESYQVPCDGLEEEEGICGGEDPGDLADGGCRVWTTIHFNLDSIYAYGYFSCTAPVGHFELQVCIQEETSTVLYPGQVIEKSYPNHGFANYGGSEGCTKGDQYSDKASGKNEASVGCEDPARSENYRSWVWGRTWWPGLFDYTGWGVSDVRWSGPVCEPSTHGAGMQ